MNCRDCQHCRTEHTSVPAYVVCTLYADSHIACRHCRQFSPIPDWSYTNSGIRCPQANCGRIQETPSVTDWRCGCCSTLGDAVRVVPFRGQRNGEACEWFEPVVVPSPAEPVPRQKSLFD